MGERVNVYCPECGERLTITPEVVRVDKFPKTVTFTLRNVAVQHVCNS